MVYTDDLYGIQGVEVIQTYGMKKGLCISNLLKVAEDEKNNPKQYYHDMATRMINNSANGIIYFGQSKAGIVI